VPAQGEEEGYYLYVDKEDFEKIDGKNWLNKKEMEDLISFKEEVQNGELVNVNYQNLFYFYDCEDSMKYYQVEENINYALN
jgi:hypothetical protein